MLRAGRIPIHEAGLQEAFDAAVAAGRLEVTGAIETDPGMILVCVGTPIDDDGQSDLSQLDSALDAIRDGFGPDDILVIRSTLPVGGTRRTIEATGLPTARVFTNPEFLRQGTAVEDFAQPSRIVVGRFPDADPVALEAVIGLYDAIEAPRHVVDVEAAEIIKNGANAFLALKLSFTNEIASLCEEAGADVDEVLDGIGADPRIGRTYIQSLLDALDADEVNYDHRKRDPRVETERDFAASETRRIFRGCETIADEWLLRPVLVRTKVGYGDESP